MPLSENTFGKRSTVGTGGEKKEQGLKALLSNVQREEIIYLANFRRNPIRPRRPLPSSRTLGGRGTGADIKCIDGGKSSIDICIETQPGDRGVRYNTKKGTAGGVVKLVGGRSPKGECHENSTRYFSSRTISVIKLRSHSINVSASGISSDGHDIKILGSGKGTKISPIKTGGCANGVVKTVLGVND